ncbi:MAG TPA: Lrp/AsnC family transcriptional regulator [Actinomycetes bacterium]|nr:Lrp/AsnC family transcriptional regulator [Actinomycetes bacterium]
MNTLETPPDQPATPRPARRRDQQLDSVDRTIISNLRANARIPYADLARLVGLSAPSVADRVKRLEQLGVITGYHAALAPAALGLGVVAIVGIEQTDEGDQDEIAAELPELDEVEDCFFVAGDESFILKVRVADVDALEKTLGRLRRIPGVSRTHTTVVLSTRFEGRAVLPPEEVQ